MNTLSPQVQTRSATRQTLASALHTGLLQRKCACGTPTASLAGECADCSSKRLQAKITVGASNDPLEAEADRVAEQLVMSPDTESSKAPPSIQRDARPAGQGTEAVPDSVHTVLSSPGRPLDLTVQEDMDKRFGHDFSRVRVHTDSGAQRSARELGANAYTVGHDLVFGTAQFAPATDSGRRLLAHELTHVVQQGASAAAPMLRAKPKKTAPKNEKPKVPQICGRNSKKIAGNWITKVKIDVGSNTLEIEWNDPKKAPIGSAGKHAISPGAGKCCVDCNDPTTSQTNGSLCTPKGGAWPVNSTSCVLSGHPSAKNPTYFQRGGIAIHTGNLSAPPQSHGCARTSEGMSELIHDNVVKGTTIIESDGTWAGTQCYLREATDKRSNRKDVCEGNKLKPAKKDKAKTKAKAKPQPTHTPTPDTDASPPKDDKVADEDMPAGEATQDVAVDGPGPNNESGPSKNIEIPVADIDTAGDEEMQDAETA